MTWRLEPQVDADPERAARREWRDIDVSGDRLIAEVADLRIESLILRPGNQVSALDADRSGPDAAPQVRDDAVRQVVGQRELAELDERGILHVLHGVLKPVVDTVGT